MRKTPPVAEQVVAPFRPTNALLQKRLIDFDTGSAEPEQQHKTWLTGALNRAKTNSAYHVRIYGYASRLGSASANQALSQARMNAVYSFLKQLDGRVLNSIEMWQAFGSTASFGDATDDSPEWRAVEVHIFIGDMPDPEPPDKRKVDPPPHVRPPLPGGPRYGRWSVASTKGLVLTIGPSIGVATAGVAVGTNFFFVRNDDTREVRRYASPTAGLGASLGLPAKTISWKNLVQTVISGISASSKSFTTVFPLHAVTWQEIESCLVTIEGVGAGVATVNANAAVVTFNCPKVEQYNSAGQPFHPAEDIWSFNTSSGVMFGAGGTATTGPLFRF
jgi:OmpA family